MGAAIFELKVNSYAGADYNLFEGEQIERVEVHSDNGKYDYDVEHSTGLRAKIRT